MKYEGGGGAIFPPTLYQCFPLTRKSHIFLIISFCHHRRRRLLPLVGIGTLFNFRSLKRGKTSQTLLDGSRAPTHNLSLGGKEFRTGLWKLDGAKTILPLDVLKAVVEGAT